MRSGRLIGAKPADRNRLLRISAAASRIHSRFGCAGAVVKRQHQQNPPFIRRSFPALPLGAHRACHEHRRRAHRRQHLYPTRFTCAIPEENHSLIIGVAASPIRASIRQPAHNVPCPIHSAFCAEWVRDHCLLPVSLALDDWPPIHLRIHRPIKPDQPHPLALIFLLPHQRSA